MEDEKSRHYCIDVGEGNWRLELENDSRGDGEKHEHLKPVTLAVLTK